MSTRAFVLVISLLIAVLIAAAGAGVWIITQGQQQAASGDRKQGSALVGGPFQLTDHTGKQVSEADYAGFYKIVYFGYTYCPDICPTGLADITAALELLGDAGAAKVKPLFITVDPDRDTVEALAAYQTHFHPRFSYLTGTPEQIAAAAAAWRVFYRKVESGDASDYLMDHSTITYLMAPGGGYLTHFGQGTAPAAIAAAIADAIREKP